MKIRRMTATFGLLDRSTLTLSEGLNIIHAPNETGKSTWSAFLRTMLYGLGTRERGVLADKNRYAPWSGAAMEGVMDLETGGREITITRQSTRRGSPMGTFSAVCTGTATPVPELSAACGEVLLGVPREIYERSAFIGQASLPIDHVGSLEQRIAALVSTGEEDTSFTEARDRLKKQLNRRRYNRTGLLPEAEAALTETESLLRRTEELFQEQNRLQEALPALEDQESRCRQALEAHRRHTVTEARRTYTGLLARLEEARDRLALQEAEAAGLPGRDGLVTLKSAAAGVVVNRTALRRTEDQLRQREAESAAAQEVLEETDLFRDLSPQEAENRAQEAAACWETLKKKGQLGGFCLAAGVILLGLCGALLALGILSLWPEGVILLLPAALLAGGLSLRSAGTQAALLAQKYRAGSREDFTARAAAYQKRWDAWDLCRQREQEARVRLESLAATVADAEVHIVEEVRRFSPETVDLRDAERAIDRGMARLERRAEALRAYDQLRAQCEALESTLPASGALSPEEALPTESPKALQEQLDRTEQELAASRRALALLQGQLQSLGDPTALAERREALTERRETLRREYEALALALEELEGANRDLQSRFSPALGAEAAQLFARLTDGRYRRVLLDRDFTAQAEREGDPISRSAVLLSQGAVDQLYLAVRLAICHLVLPAEQAAPLVLDDALVSFDDRRMALALEVLREEAKNRQVLLFTCQERELLWARGREDVHVLSLAEERTDGKENENA